MRGNRELLRSALENIVRNALQHTPAGSAIRIRLQRDAAQTEITVSDSGPGIPVALLDSIFQPFVRGEQAPAGGCGLGLAISQGAVQRHGGRLDVANRGDGPGLIVTLVLALA